MFEKVYNVFSLTERDKMVERTSAWSFCLQKRMSLKTRCVCIGRFDWSFLSVLFYSKTDAKIMFNGSAIAYGCSFLLMHLEIYMFDIPPCCCIMYVSLSDPHVVYYM